MAALIELFTHRTMPLTGPFDRVRHKDGEENENGNNNILIRLLRYAGHEHGRKFRWKSDRHQWQKVKRQKKKMNLNINDSDKIKKMVSQTMLTILGNKKVNHVGNIIF